MDVVVAGKRVEVDQALRTAAVEKVRRIEKFASDARRADVDFGIHQTRSANDSCTCEILVHLTQHLVKGTASAADHPVALDLALDKVERQMRRLHERRVLREKRARGTRTTIAADGAVESGVPEAPEEAGLEVAPIVRNKRFDAKPMSPEEAALQMDLLGHDFFVFRNAESANAAVLYRRRDGALGLIEVTG